VKHRALVVGAGNAGKAHADALEVAVDDARKGFAALRRPAEVLQVVFSYV